MAAVCQDYTELLIPEGTRWTAKQGIEYVKKAALRLLENGDWLQGLPDENVSCFWRHDKLDLAVPVGDARHAG